MTRKNVRLSFSSNEKHRRKSLSGKLVCQSRMKTTTRSQRETNRKEKICFNRFFLFFSVRTKEAFRKASSTKCNQTSMRKILCFQPSKMLTSVFLVKIVVKFVVKQINSEERISSINDKSLFDFYWTLKRIQCRQTRRDTRLILDFNVVRRQ